MANIEHSVITDPNIHEPKGAATASSGQIYSADGAGSGSFKNNIDNTHAEMAIINNVTATATAAAVDATLYTDSDYVKITAGWSAVHADGITFNTDKLTVGTSGDYLISFWASLNVPLNNNFIGIKYAVNDTTPYSTRRMKGQSTTVADYLNIGATGIVASLTAGDTLSMYIASTKTDNLVISDAGLTIALLHAT